MFAPMAKPRTPPGWISIKCGTKLNPIARDWNPTGVTETKHGLKLTPIASACIPMIVLEMMDAELAKAASGLMATGLT